MSCPSGSLSEPSSSSSNTSVHPRTSVLRTTRSTFITISSSYSQNTPCTLPTLGLCLVCLLTDQKSMLPPSRWYNWYFFHDILFSLIRTLSSVFMQRSHTLDITIHCSLSRSIIICAHSSLPHWTVNALWEQRLSFVFIAPQSSQHVLCPL